ncbi:unnamed protein product [Withania somnifera]
MNIKFGGGKPPTGTPSMAWSTLVVVVSLLAGASVVHNIFKPDLVYLLARFLASQESLWPFSFVVYLFDNIPL